MVKKVSLGGLGEALEDILRDIKESELNALDRAYKAAAIDRLGEVMIQTPVDKGRLRGAWILDSSYNNAKVGRPSRSKGSSYIKSVVGKDTMLNKTWYFYNNLPYASTVEYGGYPNPVDKGTWNKSKKRFEKRSEGGYSKLAPEGMLRVSLLSFGAKLKKAWKAQKRDNI